MTRIQTQAPIRVDLAGGTLDLWPLYLLVPDSMTINVGINLFAQAEFSVDSKGSGLTLRSDDLKVEAKIGWNELDQFQAPPALQIHTRLLRYYSKIAPEKLRQGGISLSTRARSPAGAGLGGSSALNIAITGALATWAHEWDALDVETQGEPLIEVSRDAETQVLHVPAGVQDYYGAMFGGLQSIKWQVGRHKREWLPEATLKELEKRLILFYSGKSRNSGINNWVLFKNLVEKDPATEEKFNGIARATRDLDHALRVRDFKKAADAIAAEWETRRTLAPGISTPEMDKAFKIADDLGIESMKVCGAGGGGCFFVFVPDPDPKLKEALTKQITGLGIQHLPYEAVSRGLSVKVG